MKRYDEGWEGEGMYENDEGMYVMYNEIQELLLAVDRLLECKGRDHTEQNFKALADAWEKL